MQDRLLNPQQESFLVEYLNPKSPNFSNALQSALKAGYSQEYSENITHLMPDWLSESIGDMKRLRKAEKILDKTLDMNPVDEDGRVDNQLLKTQTDTAKFFAERLNKKKYSIRKELTGEDGESINFGVIILPSKNEYTTEQQDTLESTT